MNCLKRSQIQWSLWAGPRVTNLCKQILTRDLRWVWRALGTKRRVYNSWCQKDKAHGSKTKVSHCSGKAPVWPFPGFGMIIQRQWNGMSPPAQGDLAHAAAAYWWAETWGGCLSPASSWRSSQVQAAKIPGPKVFRVLWWNCSFYNQGNECIHELCTRPLISGIMHNWTVEQKCAKVWKENKTIRILTIYILTQSLEGHLV